MVKVVYETELYLPVSAEPVTRRERSKVAERGPERLELRTWRVIGTWLAFRLCESQSGFGHDMMQSAHHPGSFDGYGSGDIRSFLDV